jgi:hypothetical protein
LYLDGERYTGKVGGLLGRWEVHSDGWRRDRRRDRRWDRRRYVNRERLHRQARPSRATRHADPPRRPVTADVTTAIITDVTAAAAPAQVNDLDPKGAELLYQQKLVGIHKRGSGASVETEARLVDKDGKVGRQGVWCLVSGVWCLVSGVWCLVSGGVYTASYALLRLPPRVCCCRERL